MFKTISGSKLADRSKRFFSRLDSLARKTKLIVRNSSKFSAEGFVLRVFKAVITGKASFNQLAMSMGQSEQKAMARQAMHQRVDQSAVAFMIGATGDSRTAASGPSPESTPSATTSSAAAGRASSPGPPTPFSPPSSRRQALTREQFIVHSIDSNATDLMRAEFAKTANGTTVRWLLLTDDIRDQNNRIQGSFSIPYEIHRDHGMSGSSISVTCSFQDASRDSLLKVRRGDWVLIQGKLSFDGSGRSARIEEAVLLDENTPPFAESP